MFSRTACLLIVAVGLIFCCGCAAEQMNKNPLQNLTDKQKAWFDRTSEGWMF